MDYSLSKVICIAGFITTMTLGVASLPTNADTLECWTPNSGASRAIAKSTPMQVAQADTIVEIAASDSTFSTLVQAVQAAGLVDTLSGEGPFTVFAPTNEAFAALPPGILETLLQPENQDTLRQILTYHVVAGAVTSGDIQPGEVATVEGSPVQLNVTNGQVSVNDATVVVADIEASNGIIHVIDRVILPPSL
jgi:uncharacterized surface protein with fasciclin (FAS1) repeats